MISIRYGIDPDLNLKNIELSSVYKQTDKLT
jgi:hypothetical protein